MSLFENIRYDQIQLGDILVGVNTSEWQNEYKVVKLIERIPTRLRVILECLDGGVHIPYSAQEYNTFRIKIRMMQYDPAQQGDTEEDI